MNRHTTFLNELDIPIEYFVFASYLNVQIYVLKKLAAFNSRLVCSQKVTSMDTRVFGPRAACLHFVTQMPVCSIFVVSRKFIYVTR